MKFLPVAVALTAVACQNPSMAAVDSAPLPANLYGFTLKDIDGRPVKLEKYKGKVIVIVNTASKCGLTPQYAGLEKFYREYKGKGVVVLGFPANDFMGQEPGSEADIKTFCSTKYDVTFPMFSKVAVKGDEKAALYDWLLRSSDRPTEDVEWNFAKFVIGKDGKLVARLKPQDTPDSPALKQAVEKALKG